MRTAIITGMFDPFTRGHEDLVRRAAALFDRVVILVSRNAEKQALLPEEVRMEAIRACFAGENVEVVPLEGLLADFVQRYESPVLVRGARSGVDFAYEAQLCAINLELGHVDTVVLPASGALSHISSTYARELIRYGKPLEGALPAPAAEIIGRHLNEKNTHSAD